MLEFGLFCLGVFALVVVLGVPYLLVSHGRLKRRVAALEAAQVVSRAQGVATSEAGVQADEPAASDADDETEQVAAPVAKGTPWSAAASVPTSDDPTIQPEDDAVEAPLPAAYEQTDETPRAFVFKESTFEKLGNWLKENWVLAAGAASLAFAGVFMVQYGAEQGLLTPFWRVMAALGFGVVLIAGGEVIRRRFGDDADGGAQYLPSALTGAGLITLFSGILAARAMYGLLSPGSALAALCFVSVVAVALGWFYGPFLSALGIVGATLAPFVVGGNSDAPWVFYYYFALIAVVGLAIDTVKRWAWVSVLALIATLAGILLLYLSGAGEVHFLMATLAVAAAAITIPERRLVPRHGGASFLELIRPVGGRRVFPEFTTRLSAAVTLVATGNAFLVVSGAGSADVVYLALGVLTLLLLATMLWMREAPALLDHALVPAVAIMALPIIEAAASGPMFREFVAGAERPPETAAPVTVWVFTALGVLGSVLAFLRMQQAAGEDDAGDTVPVVWALGGAIYGPAMVLLLEFLWSPSEVTGAYPWALACISLAALMTLLAERTARGADVGQRALRVALFAIAAMTLISLSFFLLLAKTALTLALAVMVLLTVLIDRKYDLPALGLFIQIGAAVILYRLVVDPGFVWAADANWTEGVWEYNSVLSQVLLAYFGTLILLGGAWYLTGSDRPKTRMILESTVATVGAVFVSVMIIRLFMTPGDEGHVHVGLLASVWAASMVNQLYRMQGSARFTYWLRGGLALLYALAFAVLMAGLFTEFNPLQTGGEPVVGPYVLNSLAAAYLPLSAIFAVAAWKVTQLTRWARPVFAVLSSFFAAFYVALEIRHVWRGDNLAVRGVSDPELYTYTLALLLASIGVIAVAFARRSIPLRHIGMVGVGVTIAKVFLIDMSGLSGLIRVFSFMGLGLALVGLAWINRVMKAQWDRGAAAEE